MAVNPRWAESYFAYDVPRPWEILDRVNAARPRWMSDPKRHCHGVSPAEFYGSNEGARFCNGTLATGPCPFKQQCLDWALEQNEKFGVWGGMSERMRRAERRRRLKDGRLSA